MLTQSPSVTSQILYYLYEEKGRPSGPHLNKLTNLASPVTGPSGVVFPQKR